jgi:hypothetical protein
MYIENLVFGLLNTREKINDKRLAMKLRSRTLSWSRYGYQGIIIEKDSAEEILDQALTLNYRYCLIQSYGHIITEDWHPQNAKAANFHSALKNWLETRDFFITGHILFDDELGYGLSEQALLVNLDDYRQFGRPRLGTPGPDRLPMVKALPDAETQTDGESLIVLRPSGETELCRPHLYGWNLIHTSLQNGKAVYGFDEAMRRTTLYLDAGSEVRDSCAEQEALCHDQRTSRKAVAPKGREAESEKHKQERFINSVQLQIDHSRRGVFLWNIEPYDDVATPPPNFHPPVAALYCVAAGFKPNRILHTHGFTERTRVVFFDYSLQALEIRRLLHEQWDGQDYPRFVKYILKKFPHPETFYQLWAGVSPENMNWNDVDHLWQEELRRWGGQQVFQEHWEFYKRLKPEYFPCNILTEQARLAEQIEPQKNSVIWWSNAFFTVYSNWTYTIEERQQIYQNWVTRLAARNAELFIYGADDMNTSVNFVQAGPYANHYSRFAGTDLIPHKQHRHAIRF